MLTVLVLANLDNAGDMGTYLEEEPDYKYLQSTHGNNEGDLYHAEVDDSLLRALYRGKVSVLAGAEVLLVSRDGGELSRDLEDGLLKSRCLFW